MATIRGHEVSVGRRGLKELGEVVPGEKRSASRPRVTRGVVTGEKVKLIAAGVVTAVCAAWIVYFVITSGRGGPIAPPAETPATQLATRLYEELAKNAGLPDVGVEVTGESPFTVRTTGMVRSPKELEKVRSIITTHAPGAEVSIDVAVIPH